MVQPYIFALYQYGMINSLIDYYDGVYNKTKEINMKAHGYQAGAGVDIGLFSYFGIFIEIKLRVCKSQVR